MPAKKRKKVCSTKKDVGAAAAAAADVSVDTPLCTRMAAAAANDADSKRQADDDKTIADLYKALEELRDKDAKQQKAMADAIAAKRAELVALETRVLGTNVHALKKWGYEDTPLPKIGITLYQLAKLPLEERLKLCADKGFTKGDFSTSYWQARNINAFLLGGAGERSLGWE